MPQVRVAHETGQAPANGRMESVLGMHPVQSNRLQGERQTHTGARLGLQSRTGRYLQDRRGQEGQTCTIHFEK